MLDPVFFLNWAKDLQDGAMEVAAGRFDLETEIEADFCAALVGNSMMHVASFIWSCALIGDQLKYDSVPPLRHPTYGDLCNAHTVALRLQTESISTLRLSILAIYQREFRRPVDEPPFPRILRNGTLGPR